MDRFTRFSSSILIFATALSLLLLAGCGQGTDKQPEATNASAPATAAPSGKDSAPVTAATAETVPPKADQPLSMPIYPEDAKKRKEEGSVVLKLHVLSDGSIDAVDIAKSSGFPQLDEYAVREARGKWRLKPGTVGGQPTAMWHSIKVTFKLD